MSEFSTQFLSRLINYGILVFLMAISSIIFYWMLLDPINPIYKETIEEVNIERIEGEGIYVLYITREICASETGKQLVINGEIVGRIIHSIPPFETISQEGCRLSSRRREFPALLDGDYIWSSWITACNPLRCAVTPLKPFLITVNNGELSINLDVPTDFLSQARISARQNAPRRWL